MSAAQFNKPRTYFRPKRQRLTAADYRRTRTEAHGLWVGYVA